VSLGRLGSYELIRKLPRGGNADVFVAVREGSTEEVAIKRLRAKPQSEPWRRFVQEVKVVQSLGSFPGVLPIVDAHVPADARPEDQAWYAMPVAERADEALKGAGLEGVVAAVATFAHTLTHLHAIEHHHRDIKPANLYRLDDDWLVGDFGIVQVPDAEAITTAGRKFGPANFLPYELIVNPDTARGGPVDVYELAETLWVLAAEEPYAPLGPQPADRGKFSLDRRTGGHPLAVELDRLIETCTRTDPDLRPPMTQVSADLEAWTDLSGRRARGEEQDAIGDATAELRAAFGDDLTVAQLQERRVVQARERIDALARGIQVLANQIGSGLPGGVSVTHYNPAVIANLTRPQFDQLPDPLMTGMHAVVIRLKPRGYGPELLLAVSAELEIDGRLPIKAGACVDYPGFDVGDSQRIFESDAPVESIETGNAVDASIAALRAAAPAWLARLKERSG
jgi:Protein kinase domain